MNQVAPRLVVMVSGGGRTLRNLWDRIQRHELDANIVAVGASRTCGGIEWAQEHSLPLAIGEAAMPELIAAHTPDWIVLAGYTTLVPIPQGYEHRVVNIHPSLLPSFGGRGMFGSRVHRAVLAAGCRISGCTVHLCDEVYDRGPIVAQAACAVRQSDTPEALAGRVFALECELYPRALAALFQGFSIHDGVVYLKTPIEPLGIAADPNSVDTARTEHASTTR